MKIAININELTLKQETGVKVYTREIVKALGQVDKKNEYILYANCRDGDLSRLCNKNAINSDAINSDAINSDAINSDAINRVSTNKNFKLKIAKSVLPFWTYTKLSQEIKKDKPDVLFMPIQSAPFFKKPKNIKLVITIHDLAFLLFPEHFTFKDRFLLNFHTKRAVQMADKIIAPSEATKKDLIKFYGVDEDKIEVIYHGIKNHELGIMNYELKINNPYILFVGTIQPRKNIVKLIEAFEILKTSPNPSLSGGELKLIIVGGKGWMADEIYQKAKKSKFSDEIIFKGKVSDNELANLYKNASILVLPSLYEGFGLPVLEAMSYGVPCVVSDNSSLREIAGDSALLIDAYNSNDMAEKMGALLNDEELREDLSRRGIENVKKFSWIKAAEKTLLVLSSKY